MLLGFGKHKKKDDRWVLLNDPSYRTQAPNPTGPLAAFVGRANAHIAYFDNLPLLTSCDGKPGNNPCAAPATYATAYTSLHSGLGADLCFWCATCDTSQAGAERGNLSIVRSYADIVTTAGFWGTRRDDQPHLLKKLARAKLARKAEKFTQADLEFLFGN